MTPAIRVLVPAAAPAMRTRPDTPGQPALQLTAPHQGPWPGVVVEVVVPGGHLPDTSRTPRPALLWRWAGE